MSEAWESWLAAEGGRRAEAGLTRALRVTEPSTGAWVERDGRRLLNLSSNDYLGLAGHPALREAAARAARERGAGAGSSRLVVGSDRAYAALEEKLAAFEGTERALVVGSGFLANVGVIPALLDRDCAVVSDRLNHASIIDGCRLSGATIHRYRHCDLDHLEARLVAARRDGSRRILVVTDTVFSMDGDVAPLAEIVALKDRHEAALLVDDAHGAGVLGPHGEGAAHEAGVAERVDLHLGTFSKSFGVYGAYVAAAASWIDQLVNACRTLIFSTGLPPAAVGAIDASIDLVRDAHDRRARVRAGAARARARLHDAGLDTAGSTTQIVPVVVGESETALALAAELVERGVLGVGIRPPTVPVGEARLRLSLTAGLDDEDVDRAIESVVEAARSLGLA